VSGAAAAIHDGLDRDAFVARLGGVAEGSPWVAERAWELGPFADVDALADAFRAVIASAPAERQLALIRAHPDLAGRAALAGELSPESAGEQASAGLDRLTPAQLAEFHRLNDAYRERFGFPFVVCVREHTTRSILLAYRRRLENDADAERGTALEEIAKIIRLRLGAEL
jgi:OHCU decarboxylase